MRVVIIGYGVVGQNMHKIFPDADVHDPPADLFAEGDYNVGFVCVPTDKLPNGSADTSIVRRAINENRERVQAFCIKSTVPPGTTQGLIEDGVRAVMSPEYFGATAHNLQVDFNFVILGGEPADRAIVARAYEEVKPADLKIYQTTATTAELIKYTENAWLAYKVSFCNEIARVARTFGVDYRELREGWLLDPRMSPSHTFVYPDHPYWDSHCLNKDVPALIYHSRKAGYWPQLLEAMTNYNEDSKEGLV